mgnify:CR=1 FL=1
MNTKIFTKLGIILGSFIAVVYLLFLLLPFVLNFAIDKYTPQLVGEINKLTGLSAGLEEVKIVTTPKLTAGLKVKKFELYTPQKEEILNAEDFQIKMSLLPLLGKQIRIDVIGLDDAQIVLKFDKNGDLDLLKYLPSQENTQKTEESLEPAALPFGFKLSNHLPDIRLDDFKLTITDGKDKYILDGDKTDITDFVINKSVKIKGSGKILLKDREQFAYKINLFNKIMPDVELNDLVFNPQKEEKEQEPVKFNIIPILKGLYDNNVTTNAVVDLKTSKDSIDGAINIDKISIIDLPQSSAKLNFKANKIDLNSQIYTAQNELSTISGNITTGKKPYIDLILKSDIELSNILNIVKKLALIFDVKDLQTLSANGRLNANFNLKSDMKTVLSDGYLRVPSANVYYGLYKIGIDKINADINFDDNNINIKNISLSILSHPLRIFGTLTKDAVADIHVTADKLSLKGLLVAAGQAALLKENPVYSGAVSMDVIIKGALDKINPIINLDIENLNLKNIPTDITLKAPATKVNITSDGKTFGGKAVSSNVMLINPALKVSVPNINANIKENEIEITQTPTFIEKIKTNIHGKITNYLTEKIGLDFVSTGDIKSTLKGDININKQTLNLVYSTTDMSTIIIPMFDKSKLSFKGKINITGNMLNPIISGSASVPSISIPEIPVDMNGMELIFNGTILHGSGTLKEFKTGGIKAENLTSDFELKGMDFYLRKLKGDSFGGKVSGNIVYNLSNAKSTIEFKGTGLNAEKAIAGAAGIKKALTGVLGFDTKLTLTVLDYNDMIKSMKGNLDFNIKNGAFGTIGRFEGLLNASNIVNNYLLKNTVAAITNATGLATTAQFDNMDGHLTFSNGWANLNPIKSAGQSLCYYITGKYNLLNGTTNVTIWGRLDAPMVAKLGPIGELSANKILGYIPKFGSTTAKILNILTTNPKGEPTDKIPALTNGSSNYKDFKVSFNGGIESKSSVKSFKWLSNPDLSEYQKKSTAETLNDIKSSFNTDIKNTVEDVKTTIQDQKKLIEDTKTDFKNSAEEIKNLFKSIKQTNSEPASTPETKTPPATEAEENINQTQNTETLQQ